MNIAVNTYPFLLTASVEEAVDSIVGAGYKEIEFLLSPPHFTLSETLPGRLRALKTRMDAAGVRTKSVLMPSLDLNLCSPFPEMRAMSVDLYKKVFDIAAALESDGVVVILGKRHVLLPPPLDYILDLARDSLEELIRYSEPSGVAINIETIAANLLDTVADTVRFVDEVNDPRVRLCFDVANVYTEEDVEAALDMAKGRINLVHMSDSFKSRTGHEVIGAGEMDFRGIRKSLERIGYTGSAVIEITDCGGIDSINRSRDHLLRKGWNLS